MWLICSVTDVTPCYGRNKNDSSRLVVHKIAGVWNIINAAMISELTCTKLHALFMHFNMTVDHPTVEIGGNWILCSDDHMYEFI